MSMASLLFSESGLPVEINALWYNAICFALDLADNAGDYDFVEEWETMREKGRQFIFRNILERRSRTSGRCCVNKQNSRLVGEAKYGHCNCTWIIHPFQTNKKNRF